MDRLLGTKSAITIWCQKFKNLKVGSLFASDNSEPKIIFEFYFLIFLSFFWCHLKVGSLFGVDNFEPIIIFLDFCQFFWCPLIVGSLFASDNSDPKIFFFLDFLSFFGVDSLFASDNSEPKIIFEFFFLIFCQFFGVILKLVHYSVQTILSQK